MATSVARNPINSISLRSHPLSNSSKCFEHYFKKGNCTYTFNKILYDEQAAEAKPSLPVDLKHELESFIEALRTLFSNSTYGFYELRVLKNVIESKFYDLNRVADKNGPLNERVFELLVFSRKLYVLLSDLIDLLFLIERNTSLDRSLAHSVIDLNIRILHLYDSSGKPDFADPEFGDNVWRYKYYLSKLKEEFDLYFMAPPGARILFETLLFQANGTLYSMMQYLPP